jgi:hypothetical protein
MGCNRVLERIAAATGNLKAAPTIFQTVKDVPNAGVLCALPSLLENGIINKIHDYFKLPDGYYSLVHIILFLGFMALARIKSIEQLRYSPPGEWGKLLGLDRIPEVKTIREKIKILAENGEVGLWAGELSKEWMEADPEEAGILYVDGHVHAYYGKKNKLPRRYVARQRLCLRGLTDYWVNDQTGRPFFVISTPFTSGLLSMLKDEIIPRLKKEVPGQPCEEKLKADKYKKRFVIIFDREGYSPAFIDSMWKDRIACQTYNKYPKADWPEKEFSEYEVTLVFGEKVKMKLAERGVYLGKKIWVREIRKLTEKKHQTSIISTDYESDITDISSHMFARWSQENFFKYMLQNYNIDRFISYNKSKVDETRLVVNPAYRHIESQIKSKASILSRSLAEFGELNLKEINSKDVSKYEEKMSELKEKIDYLEQDLKEMKTERKKIQKHIKVMELPEEEKFKVLAPTRQHFINTIKMIAYRSETSLVVVLKEIISRTDDARALLREIFTTEGDLIPNEEDGTLTVKLHHLTNQMSDRTVRELLNFLNDTETIYPGTNLRMIYKMVSN